MTLLAVDWPFWVSVNVAVELRWLVKKRSLKARAVCGVLDFEPILWWDGFRSLL